MTSSELDLLQQLFQRYFEGLSTEAEIAELNQRIANDPAVADQFAQAAVVHMALERQFKQALQIEDAARFLTEPPPPVVETPQTFVRAHPTPPKAQRTEANRRVPVWAWGTAAAALILLLAFWLAPRQEIWISSGQLMANDAPIERVPFNVILQTAGDEPTVLHLRHRGSVNLEPGTRFSLIRQQEQILVRLQAGEAECTARVGSDRRPLWIESPVATVRATDATFTVAVTEIPSAGVTAPTSPTPPWRMHVAVSTGRVEVESMGAHWTLAAGESHTFGTT
jgi:ferric-dicitrate binding protein FerR (iron transport regulator)